MCDDSFLDSFMEERLSGGPCPDDAPDSPIGDDMSEFDGEPDPEDGPSLLPGEDMDGDATSALASAGFGTDEDYGGGTHDWEQGSLED